MDLTIGTHRSLEEFSLTLPKSSSVTASTSLSSSLLESLSFMWRFSMCSWNSVGEMSTAEHSVHWNVLAATLAREGRPPPWCAAGEVTGLGRLGIATAADMSLPGVVGPDVLEERILYVNTGGAKHGSE